MARAKETATNSRMTDRVMTGQVSTFRGVFRPFSPNPVAREAAILAT